MITIADAWVQEGFEKGVQEGRQTGRQETLDNVARRLFKLHNVVIASEPSEENPEHKPRAETQ